MMLIFVLTACSEYVIKGNPLDSCADTDVGEDTSRWDSGPDTDPGPECPSVDAPPQPVVATCLDPVGPLAVDVAWTYADGHSAVLGACGVSVGPLLDSNRDGQISAEDQPYVVFGGHADRGRYVALSGADGSVFWKTSNKYLHDYGSALLADLDGDGGVEVVVFSGEGGTPPNRIVFFDGATGVQTRSSSDLGLDFGMSDSLAAADVDGDGVAEVLDGHVIVDAAGGLVAVGSAGQGGILTTERGGGVGARQSYGVDLDGDTRAEVLAGTSAYRGDGTTLWDQPSLPDGHSVVADFDGDGEADVLTTSGQWVWGAAASGVVEWGPFALEGECDILLGSGPVAVEDLDDDGLPEFVVPCRTRLAAYAWGGTVLWSIPINDSSTASGAAIADVDGDGYPEVAYGDQYAIYLLAGQTGAYRWTGKRNSGTAVETPVFADIDLDGTIEMLITSQDRLTAYRADPAGPGRTIWNSHSYHISDINDDMTVPAVSEHYWLTTNSFRSAGLGDRLPDVDVYPMFVDVCDVECDQGDVVITATVANGGSAPAAPGLEVILTAGVGGPVVASATTTEEVPPHSTGEVLRFDVRTYDLLGLLPTLEVDPAGARRQCLTLDDNDVVSWPRRACVD